MIKQVGVGCLIYVMLSIMCFAAADYWMPDRIGISAQSIRLGGVEAFDETSATVFGNPAGLYQTENLGLSVFSTKIMNEVDYKNISCTLGTPFIKIGVGYFTMGVDGIPKTAKEEIQSGFNTDIYVKQIGEFSYKNSMAKLALSYSQNERLHLGVSGVYYMNELDTYTGKGYNIDAGFIWQMFDPLYVSVHIKNLLSSQRMRYFQDGELKGYENLSLQSFYSFRYNLNELTVLFQYKILGSNQQSALAGGLQYSPSFASFIKLSGGYKQDYVLNDIVNRFTGGIGLDLFGIQFDYAYEQSEHIEYNAKHYFSFGIAY